MKVTRGQQDRFNPTLWEKMLWPQEGIGMDCAFSVLFGQDRDEAIARRPPSRSHSLALALLKFSNILHPQLTSQFILEQKMILKLVFSSSSTPLYLICSLDLTFL